MEMKLKAPYANDGPLNNVFEKFGGDWRNGVVAIQHKLK